MNRPDTASGQEQTGEECKRYYQVFRRKNSVPVNPNLLRCIPKPERALKDPSLSCSRQRNPRGKVLVMIMALSLIAAGFIFQKWVEFFLGA